MNSVINFLGKEKSIEKLSGARLFLRMPALHLVALDLRFSSSRYQGLFDPWLKFSPRLALKTKELKFSL
jgi:hypothetical protein